MIKGLLRNLRITASWARGNESSPPSGTALDAFQGGKGNGITRRLLIGGAIGTLATRLGEAQDLSTFKLIEVPLRPVEVGAAKEVRERFLRAYATSTALSAYRRTGRPQDYFMPFNEVLMEKLGLAGPSLKTLVARMVRENAVAMAPMPPIADVAMIAVANRMLRTGPESEKTAKQVREGAVAMIKRYMEADQASNLDVAYAQASPSDQARLFIQAMKAELKDHLFPTAYSEYVVLNPGDDPKYEVGRLDRGSMEGWDELDHAGKTERFRSALLRQLDSAERAVAPNATPADFKDLTARLWLTASTGRAPGPDLVGKYFGETLWKNANGNRDEQNKLISAAAAMDAAWYALLVTYW